MKLVFSILLTILSLVAFSQTKLKENATALGITNNWCSSKAAYATAELTEEQPVGNCYDKSFTYGKWFKFLATSNNIEALVKIDKGDGTMRFPYIYLYDQELNVITCHEPLDDTTNISIKSSKLTVGSWYYLGIYNHNHSKYVGSFTLCMNNEISNDFIEGAYEIFDTDEWCSENGEFTTKKATPDGKKPACLSNGPNFNRWFTFKAQSKNATIEVEYGAKYGTCQFPYLTLWDERLNEIACDNYTNEHQEIKIKTDKLTPNKKYFISVDHQYNEKYQGSFTLCVNNSPVNENEVVVKTTDLQKANLEQILGKLMFNTSYKPVAGQKISLLENSKTVASTSTDPNGKFVFNNIEPNKNFMVVIENQPDGILFEIYQTKSDGEIVKQVVKHNRSSFGFEDLHPACNKIVLLDCNRSFDLNVSPGMVGMIGKVVNRQNPTNSISDVSVYLYDNSKQVLDSTKTNLNGDFEFVNLVNNDNYMIKLGISLDKVFAEVVVVNDKGNAISTATSKNASPDGFFSFQKLPYMQADPLAKMNFEDVDINTTAAFEAGSSIVLNNIYFNQGDDELLPESHKELDKLVDLLNKNKELKIEIGGHTDNFGTDELNLSLSTKRALAVKNYLVQKGISDSRLKHKGYGSSKPIADNDTAEGRKKNRRVEFVIL